MLDAYVPVTSLLYVLLFVLGGYICYLVGYRRALADFPVEDTPPVGIEVHSDNEWERLDDACKWLETDNYKLSKRLDALEEQGYKEGYDRSPGSYWERLDIIENWKASLGKLSETSLPSFDDLVERVDELERANTKQVFDERVEHSVPFGQWALDVSERSKTNQARVEELEHTTTRLLVDRACSGITVGPSQKLFNEEES